MKLDIIRLCLEHNVNENNIHTLVIMECQEKHEDNKMKFRYQEEAIVLDIVAERCGNCYDSTWEKGECFLACEDGNMMHD